MTSRARSSLATAGLSSSPLGLGCAELFREPSAARRRGLLHAALEAGICHFDVAPMYGLGIAERELGRFARGRRDQLVIATKFGISPTIAAQGLARIQGPVRRVLAASPRLRAQARSGAAGPASGGAGSLLYRSSGYDAAGARLSLERSLRALRVDHVDLLLLHDPPPSDVRHDDVCAYLEQARTAGRVRAWGIAGEPGPTVAVARAMPTLPQVIQVRDDLVERPGAAVEVPADAGRITFGVLGSAIGRVVTHVAADPNRSRRWRDEVGVPCTHPGHVAGLLLAAAHAENPDGVVLFGSIDREHVARAAAAVLREAEVGDVTAFLRLVESECGAATSRADF
ncbi:MAG: aldo/keto reductase [Solirubrobacteraceae bacterium]